MPKQTLTLIRGIPGSGKSTMAKALPAILVEADMYFIDEHGRYTYRREQIKQAHAWCKQRTRELLLAGQNVVVANTFIKLWELRYYQDLAKELGLNLEILEAKGRFNNIHDVPEFRVQQMLRDFEPLA